jgi:hypothetical protein
MDDGSDEWFDGDGHHELTDGRDDDLDELIHRVDLDGLVRLVDARCETRDWEGLRRVRDRARAAASTGRQLWPATTLASYRLALLAPAPWAAEAVTHTGRFTIGPLTEVVAQHHTWRELAAHLDTGPTGRYVAHERALRGDTIAEHELDRFAPVIDIPADLRSWEPTYQVAVYHDSHAEFPAPPWPTRLTTVTHTVSPAEQLDDAGFDDAVRHLLSGWTADSEGRASTVCVQGDAASAVSALGVTTVRLAEIDRTDAIAWLAWAGASGGAHGRRRGAAAGRDGAWWVLGAIGDLHDRWPPSDQDMTAVLDDLRWHWWADAHEPQGWTLRLVVTDTHEGVSWAIDAGDAG